LLFFFLWFLLKATVKQRWRGGWTTCEKKRGEGCFFRKTESIFFRSMEARFLEKPHDGCSTKSFFDDERKFGRTKTTSPELAKSVFFPFFLCLVFFLIFLFPFVFGTFSTQHQIRRQTPRLLASLRLRLAAERASHTLEEAERTSKSQTALRRCHTACSLHAFACVS